MCVCLYIYIYVYNCGKQCNTQEFILNLNMHFIVCSVFLKSTFLHHLLRWNLVVFVQKWNIHCFLTSYKKVSSSVIFSLSYRMMTQVMPYTSILTCACNQTSSKRESISLEDLFSFLISIYIRLFWLFE